MKELLIPINPIKVGGQDFGNQGFSHDAIWVALKAIPKNDEYEGGTKFRLWDSLSLYIWFQASGSVDITLKAHEIFSANERDMAETLKNMKWANARIKDLGTVTLENLPYRLTWLCQQLGIKRTLQYGRPNTYAPVEIALEAIVKEVQRRVGRFPK